MKDKNENDPSTQAQTAAVQAAIVAVGTELLFGTTVNTNAAYISERLHEIGIGVLAHYAIGDNPQRLARTLETAFTDTDIVLVTGGLGPTQDDLTKEVIAEFIGAQLVFDEEAKRRLDEIMSQFSNATYTANNTKQAWLPEGCTPFYNSAGTAPGFALEKNGRLVIAMPGPPREMRQMMSEWTIPYLTGRSDYVISSQMLHFFGAGESYLETLLLPIIDGQTDPTVATYAHEGECLVRVSSRRATLEEAESAVAKTVARARELAGDYLYSETGQSYAEVIVELLKARGYTLAAAESCTGGLFAGAITAIPGSSEVFDRSYVTYSNRAKVEMLGVPLDVIAQHGAVSEECCRAMAIGALQKSQATIAVAVTGISGPGGSVPGKPVGTVYYGIAVRGIEGAETMIHVVKRDYRDRGRKVNRDVSVLELCDLIRRTVV